MTDSSQQDTPVKKILVFEYLGKSVFASLDLINGFADKLSIADPSKEPEFAFLNTKEDYVRVEKYLKDEGFFDL